MAPGEDLPPGPPPGGREGRELVGQARALRVRVTGEQAAATVAVREPAACRVAVRSAHDAARAEIARAQLTIMPLDQFKDAFPKRFRVAAVGWAGCETVGDVLDAADRLRRMSGPDSATAGRAVDAARQLQAALTEVATVRFSAEERTAGQTRLLAALRDYERAKGDLPEPFPGLDELASSLRDALEAVPAVDGSRMRRMLWALAAGPAGRARARDGLARLAALMAAPGTAAIDAELTARARKRARVRDGRGSAQPDAGQLWADYLARPAAYHGLLREAAGLAPDEASIQRYPLDLSLVTARLRGHQASGASFALIQERAIIGDERRLGKTVTALAAMAHLAAGGATHFFVICPANAVAYWTRETGRHTRLVAHRLHGSERFSAWQRWLAEGGVAVASFSVLSYQPRLPPEAQLAMLTVDEAHYTKNPDTDRTRAVLAWIAATPRTLLLTSAPLESKPAELCVLIGHLRPDLAKRLTPIAGILGAEGLRQAVAPVYLRRTESDLVDDLPPLSALPTPRDGLPTAGSRRSAR